jgi:hypothetical protein
VTHVWVTMGAELVAGLHVPPASPSGDPHTPPSLAPPELLDESACPASPASLDPPELLDDPLLDEPELPELLPELELLLLPLDEPVAESVDASSEPAPEGVLELELHAIAAVPAVTINAPSQGPRVPIFDIFMVSLVVPEGPADARNARRAIPPS